MFIALCTVFDELERQLDSHRGRATRHLRSTVRGDRATSSACLEKRGTELADGG
jgi:ribosome-associated translation inhibitor RaiA